MHDRQLRAAHSGHRHGVEKEGLGLGPQRLDRDPHRQQARAQDVAAVDLPGAHDAHAQSDGAAPDLDV